MLDATCSAMISGRGCERRECHRVSCGIPSTEGEKARAREALKKLESWKPWSRGAAVTAEGQLQCSFLTIFPACFAPPRDIEVPNSSADRTRGDRCTRSKTMSHRLPVSHTRSRSDDPASPASRSRNASPSRVHASTVTTRARPGAIATHGAATIRSRPPAIMFPQLGCGG